jgi:hypothetical protein
MDGIFNQRLYGVVRNLYDEVIAEFGSQDFQSEEFLSSFPYGFVAYGDNEERRRRIVDAALLPEFRQEAQNCVDACYSDSSGGDLEFYISLAVEDFLNYIIPRSVGLPNGSEIFDRYYRYFDSSIYGKSCLITIFALIRDLWDHHGGSAVLPTGFRFVWMVRGFGPLSIPYTRERAVPFFEIKKAAHPIGWGRDVTGENAFQVLEYSTSLPKNRGLLPAVYSLMHDVAAKFLLATRIKTYSTAHCDYRGFRMLGHLSAHSMNLMNYPDDRIEHGEGRDLNDSDGMAVDRLLTKLLPQPLSKFAVINQKLEDAIRRRRTAILHDARARKLNEIDQLLDYFQVLEAIVPAEGSEYISLYAARLLSTPESAPNQTFELFQFLKDMFKIRNSVLHGRIDEVLSGKLSQKLDIFRLRHVIYSLTCLHIMNGPLREIATRLALGETAQIEREYESNQDEWMKRHRSAVLRNANVVFW